MSWESDLNQWRQDREETLKAPFGVLSWAGLVFLDNGVHTVGPAGTVSVPRAEGPLGTLEVTGETIRFRTSEGITFPLAEDQPFYFEDYSLTPVRRSGRWALRLKDNRAETRTRFQGLLWAPGAPGWDLTGRWEPAESVQEFHGKAVFEGPQGPFSLWGQVEEPGKVFLNFRDKTSGLTTYGSGRFLQADLGTDGTVRADFNRAYNPPCAFTAHAACPLPTADNHLGFAVDAGERVP